MSLGRWKGDLYFVSPYNYVDEVRKNLKLPEKVIIHDTTLRDGEQQAGIVFRKDEKIKIAIALDEVGVDRIEVAMPAVSQDDFETLKEVAKLGLRAKVMAFARCLKQDVDLALKADVSSIVMELPSSIHMIEKAYRWTISKAIERAVEAVEYAKQHGLFVTFFTIDSTRSDIEFLRKIIGSVHDYMDSLSLADTLGVMTPFAITYFINLIKTFVKKPIEIHPHNDFGLAVANALAAVASGASAVHVTVNGIGERAGNASLEETVLALELLLGVKTNVKIEKLYELSKLVERLSGVKLPPHKPVVGETPYATESGIIADWWLAVKDNDPTIAYPILPRIIGRKEDIEIVLGKKSGRANIVYALKNIGIDPSSLSEDTINKILQEVKFHSILKKGPLSLEEFNLIVKRILSA